MTVGAKYQVKDLFCIDCVHPPNMWASDLPPTRLNWGAMTQLQLMGSICS
eukprot:NODE_3372_length_937_cov_4.671171_g2813_i0.p6 GENE.NODE_3372_length_937_cov_4.671171_g2813_i0~~NODE_3372_length_937_cov_4.671171_g2813_i0.p6  ORF type:complete len:50 (-),score=10.67 NODE_3372_length_937_cov_4.671171_g2813_i0:719-868(-)